MKEPYGEGLASHTGSESCAFSRKAGSEALTGAHAGGVLSRDMLINQSADVVHDGGRQHRWVREGEHSLDSARSETPACMETPRARTRRLCQRPTRRGAGRLEKVMSHKSNMNVGGESHGRVVPAKCPNKDGKPLAEGAEGRRPTKENTEQTTASQTQCWGNALSGLSRVREAAKKDKRLQFTALLHHVTIPLLLDSFYALKREAAPGVDGVTWKDYETDLDRRLEDLHRRVHQGTYRAQPSKRAYIAK